MKRSCLRIITCFVLMFSATASAQAEQDSLNSSRFSYTRFTLSESSSVSEADLSAVIAAIASVDLTEGAPFRGLIIGRRQEIIPTPSPQIDSVSADNCSLRGAGSLLLRTGCEVLPYLLLVY